MKVFHVQEKKKKHSHVIATYWKQGYRRCRFFPEGPLLFEHLQGAESKV